MSEPASALSPVTNGNPPASATPVVYTHTQWWEAAHRHFLSNGDDSVESDLSHKERWDNIIECLPEMAQRALHHDLTDVYEEAYFMSHGTLLVAVFDCAILQWRFLKSLSRLSIGLSHVLEYHITNVEYWGLMLSNKIELAYEPEDSANLQHLWMN